MTSINKLGPVYVPQRRINRYKVSILFPVFPSLYKGTGDPCEPIIIRARNREQAARRYTLAFWPTLTKLSVRVEEIGGPTIPKEHCGSIWNIKLELLVVETAVEPNP